MTIEDLQQFCLHTRLKKGILQREIEQNTGVTDTTLSRWENGKGGIRLDTLMLILHELGYKLEVVTDGSMESNSGI